MDPLDIAKTTASIVGPIVGIATLGFGVFKFARERHERAPAVRVATSMGLPTFPAGGVGDWLVLIEAANHGSQPVVLASVVLVTPRGEQLVSLRPAYGGGSGPLPRRLPPGESHMMWLPSEEVNAALRRLGYRSWVKVRGEYRDQLGNRYTSPEYEIDLGAPQPAAAADARPQP